MKKMIVDISGWGFEKFPIWGFFIVQSDQVLPGTQSLFTYSAHLDASKNLVTFFSTKNLFGINHAYLASYFAASAFRKQRNFAKDLSMELLLYLSQQNQINIAISSYGISERQKKAKEEWGIIFFSATKEVLIREKETLEQIIGVKLGEPAKDLGLLMPNLNAERTLQLRVENLPLVEKNVHEIPLLPAKSSSTRETAIIHVLIEKMVLLSLSRLKLEL